MTTRREIRNAQVAAFFAQTLTLVGPITLSADEDKFTGVFGEKGRNGFLLKDEAGTEYIVGETNLRLGAPDMLPAKVTKREARAEVAQTEMAALPALSEAYAEIVDGETVTLESDAETDALIAEFDTIMAEYGIDA